jgi:serine/threonine protein phosphatase PrpC
MGAVTRELLLKMKQEPDKLFPIQIPGEQAVTAMKYYEIAVTLTHSLGSGDPRPSLVIAELEPGEALVFCTDGVVDKFETKPSALTTPQNVLETSLELDELAKAFVLEDSIVQRVDNLRTEATMRYSYKSEDDIAIVAVQAKEEKA